MKKFVKNILLIFNLLAATAILFAYASAYISPADVPFFAFLGLLYPFLLFINILFILFWLWRKDKFFMISVFAIIIGWNFLASFFQINFNKKDFKKNEKSLKVLSYNVRVFNLWNWSADKNRRIKTYDFIKDTHADIVCLQEFYSSKRLGKNAVDSLQKNSNLTYKYVSFTKNKTKVYHHGIAIFSIYPIVYKGTVKLENFENFCIYADIKTGKDTLRVYNVHLESIHLGDVDYQAIDNLDNDTLSNAVHYKNILKKLKTAYINRARQVDLIAAHIEKSPHKVILCGDFNDPPFSYSYHRITRKLTDAYMRSGIGFSSTYIHRFSIFRIDYILHTPSLKSYNYKRFKVELSDHYPIETDFLIE
ncbi:MAG: endonuclease/exonuclease/phosphatase family protein [Bacteroidales bacterium]|nr:endonuclease/exonuclease/phosphatase family protein [Bacteroidales bacterium]